MRTLTADLFDFQARAHVLAALSFDFGIGSSFGFGFCGSFFDGRTPGTAIVRHLLPVPLVDIGDVEVSLCAVHVV